ITGENQVWKLVGPNSFPIQMTTGQNPTFLKQITPNGQFLILEKDTDGQENPGLFLQPTKGGELTLIFQKPNVRASFNFISQDGKSLYFTANDLKPDTMTIYRYDIDEKKITKVSDRNGVWAVADQFQEQLLLVKMTGSTGREYYELNTKTDELSPLLGQNEYTTYQVAYTKTPGTFFVMTNKFTDLQRLYLYKKITPKTKKEIWKLFANQPEDEIEEFNVSPKKDRLMILYNQKGYFKPKVYNVNGQLISMPKFDSGETVVPGDFDWTGKKISLSSSSSKSPRKNVIYNFETQKSQVWNFGSTPQIDSATFSEEILEYYTAQDGTKIPMFVMRPKSCINKLCPVIVQFHGGPEAQSMAGFSGYKQSFAAAGFVFVSPNVRGSTGYGKAWLDSDNGPLRLKVITDIEDCAKHIRSQWKINGVSPRVGVMGGSYGGYSTLMAMSKFAGAYDAGVASVGMSDLRSFLMNTAPYRRILRITEYGDPEKDAEALKQLSPITYVDQIKDPLLIIQGANDPRVPVGEAIQIKRVLDQKQIAARLIIFADEGHGSAKLENQILEVGNTVEFFKLHLAEKSTEKVQ
ncbi:MAG: prolyl oligopeptidase family serine peptidase, partial [Pseudobdellovibrionaceae bacterium]